MLNNVGRGQGHVKLKASWRPINYSYRRITVCVCMFTRDSKCYITYDYRCCMSTRLTTNMLLILRLYQKLCI